MSKNEIKLSKEDRKQIEAFTKQQHAEMQRILNEFTQKVDQLCRELAEPIIKKALEKEIKNYKKGKGWFFNAVNKKDD